MDVGVLTVPFGDEPLDETLDYLDGIGVDAIELGVGGYPGDAHLPPTDYLDDADARSHLYALLEEYG